MAAVTVELGASQMSDVHAGAIANALTIDVEDYFQVAAFAGQIKPEDWPSYPSRVDRNVRVLLDLLARHEVKATFFTLGWIAERHPDLIKAIVANGHELASHGYGHVPVYSQDPNEFRKDVERTKAILEDLASAPIRGYRAASFSVRDDMTWVFEQLAEAGHTYSSSIYPVRHDIYGSPNAPRFPHRPKADSGVLEIPISTVSLIGRNWPCGGGGYFRLLPYAYFKWAIKRMNVLEQHPSVFYLHPWEVDPDQPRVARAPIKSKFRHYLNLSRMEQRLSRLLRDFSWTTMSKAFHSSLGS